MTCSDGLYDPGAIDICLNCTDEDCDGWCEKLQNKT